MKERGSRNKIFSSKNLLIGFIVIIIFLLIFNYFYPVFLINNKFFNQNFNLGELYATKDGEGSSPDPPGSDDRAKGCDELKCDKKCQKCVPKTDGTVGSKCIDLSFCMDGNSHAFCYKGKCPDCKPDCKECQICVDLGEGKGAECVYGLTFPVGCRDERSVCSNKPDGSIYCPDCKGTCKECQLCVDVGNGPECGGPQRIGNECVDGKGIGICDGDSLECPNCEKDCDNQCARCVSEEGDTPYCQPLDRVDLPRIDCITGGGLSGYCLDGHCESIFV